MKYSIVLLLSFSTIITFAMDQGTKELASVSNQTKQEITEQISGELKDRTLAIIDEIANKLSDGNPDKKPVAGDKNIDIWLRAARNDTDTELNMIYSSKVKSAELLHKQYMLIARKTSIDAALGITALLQVKLEYASYLEQSKNQPK